MTDTPAENGLPNAAQPWARDVETFMREVRAQQRRNAMNSEAALAASGNAVVAAANSVQAQANVQSDAERVPATLDSSQILATPSTYFDSTGTPWGRIDLSVASTDLDTDGNPLIPTAYQAWGRRFFAEPPFDPDADIDDSIPVDRGPEYLRLATSPTGDIQINGLQVGITYQVKVAAVSDSGASGDLSNFVTATTPDALTAMDRPSAPTLQSGAGMLVISWDGKLGTAIPPVQFRHVYAEVSPAGSGTWTRVGSVLVRGGGSIQVSRLTLGQAYDVRLIAVDSLDVATAPSDTATITILGVDIADLAPDVLTVVGAGGNHLTWADTGPSADGVSQGDVWFQHDVSNSIIAQWQWLDGAWVRQTLSHEVISSIDLGSATVGTLDGGLITANTIGADQIVAGSITVNELSPTIGGDLDITANDTVTIIAGQVQSVTADTNATADSLGQMQTFYAFGPAGAVISSPGSPFQLALRSDRIEMLQNGASVSYWNAGQMFVDSFVGSQVVLGNHKLEKYGTGTVVRAL